MKIHIMKSTFHAAVLSLVLSLGFTPFTISSSAAQTCSDLFGVAKADRFVDPRAEVVALARQKSIPMVLVPTANGTIPALQLNEKTAPLLVDLINQSMGTLVQLQPTWRNDHGMLRVAGKVIDVDTPGARGFGELHQTGLAWKSLMEWLPRRRGTDNTVVEVGYQLSKPDLATAAYYQMIRRAAIIRAPFTFGGAGAKLASPTTLQDGENCFSFARGSALSGHVRQMESEILKLTGESFKAISERPEVQQLLERARAEIASMKSDNEKLNDQLAQNWPESREVLNLKPNDPNLINWLIGLDASSRYLELITRLGISGESSFQDMNHKSASFVLIYDDVASKKEFEAREFTRKGIFSTWNHANAVP